VAESPAWRFCACKAPLPLDLRRWRPWSCWPLPVSTGWPRVMACSYKLCVLSSQVPLGLRPGCRGGRAALALWGYRLGNAAGPLQPGLAQRYGPALIRRPGSRSRPRGRPSARPPAKPVVSERAVCHHGNHLLAMALFSASGLRRSVPWLAPLFGWSGCSDSPGPHWRLALCMLNRCLFPLPAGSAACGAVGAFHAHPHPRSAEAASRFLTARVALLATV